MKWPTVFLALVAALTSTWVSAGDQLPNPAAQVELPNAWDVALGGALLSDNNVRGISISARRPSANAYIEPRFKLNKMLELYGGVSGSSVDFPNRARAQFVYYGGARPTIGPASFDIGIAYVDYPGGLLFNGRGSPASCTNGAFFYGQCNTSKAVVNFWEGYVKATYEINETLSVGPNFFYSPSWLNSGAAGAYASAIVKAKLPSSALPKDFSAFLSAEMGHYWFGTTDSFYGVPSFPGGIKLPAYTTWNAGLTITYKAAALDLRYYDTNLTKANCNVLTGDQTATFGGPSAATPINPSGLVSNWCGPAFIVKLSLDTTVTALR